MSDIKLSLVPGWALHLQPAGDVPGCDNPWHDPLTPGHCQASDIMSVVLVVLIVLVIFLVVVLVGLVVANFFFEKQRSFSAGWIGAPTLSSAAWPLLLSWSSLASITFSSCHQGKRIRMWLFVYEYMCIYQHQCNWITIEVPSCFVWNATQTERISNVSVTISLPYIWN